MGTVPGGSKTDPWALALSWAKQMHQEGMQQDAIAEHRRDLDTRRRYTLEDQASAPNREYARRRAFGSASIENAIDAQNAGVSFSGRTNGTNPSASRVASEFQRGLSDGGVTNPFGLAAALANGQVESAGWNPNAVGDNGSAAHIMQWREGRQKQLREFAQKNGDNPDRPSPYTQGKFAAWEMQNTESAAGKIILNARSLGEAQQGMQQFLRMKDYDKGANAHGFAARAGALNTWYRKITGAKPEANEAAVTTPANDGWISDDSGEYSIKYMNMRQYEQYKAALPEMTNNLEPYPEGAWDSKGNMPFKYYRKRNANPAVTPAPATSVATSVPPSNAPVVEIPEGEQPLPDVNEEDHV